MIVFTSGFPKSGKTYFAQKLLEKLDNKLTLHINPEDYYPDDFNDLPQDERAKIAIAAWELCLEKVTKSICMLPNRVLIIFDTCCNKSLYMEELFMASKTKNHHIFMIYLNTSLKKRIERTNNNNLMYLEKTYQKSFKTSLPILKNYADKFIIIDNNDDSKVELSNYVNLIYHEIRKIRDKCLK